MFSVRRRFRSSDPGQDAYTHHHPHAKTTVKQQKMTSITLVLIPSHHTFVAATTDTNRNTTTPLEGAMLLVARSDAAHDLKYHQNIKNVTAVNIVNAGYCYGLQRLTNTSSGYAILTRRTSQLPKDASAVSGCYHFYIHAQQRSWCIPSSTMLLHLYQFWNIT